MTDKVLVLLEFTFQWPHTEVLQIAQTARSPNCTRQKVQRSSHNGSLRRTLPIRWPLPSSTYIIWMLPHLHIFFEGHFFPLFFSLLALGLLQPFSNRILKSNLNESVKNLLFATRWTDLNSFPQLLGLFQVLALRKGRHRPSFTPGPNPTPTWENSQHSPNLARNLALQTWMFVSS